jgi:aminopeptidase N
MNVPRSSTPPHRVRGWFRTIVGAVALAVVAGCGTAGTLAGQEPTSASRTTASPSAAPPLPLPSPGSAIPTGPTRAPAGQAAPDAGALRRAVSHPVEDPYYPDTSNPEFDALHYGLSLAWDPRARRLTGTATIVFRVARSQSILRLDLSSALGVRTLTLDGRAVDNSHHGNNLWVRASKLRVNSRHTLLIAYEGTPRPTAAPSERSDQGEGLGWSTAPDGTVYTFQEPYGAFTWFPVNDHPSDKALYDITIRSPHGWRGVSNGRLVSTVKASDQTIDRWHLESPAASYLTTVAIGPYSQTRLLGPHGLPVSLWWMPTDEALVVRLRQQTVAALSWLNRHLGRYPFSSAGVVLVGGASAMESQTMVTMSSGALNRPDAVVLHELAHQWYGDAVTPVNWLGLWLNEGFAMYVQHWYETEQHVSSPFSGSFRHWRLLDRAMRAQAGPPGHFDKDKFADPNVYICPALMLNEVRKRIGDTKFETMMKAWPAQHRLTNQDRRSFTRWINRFTGRDLTRLIDRWLDSPTTPK